MFALCRAANPLRSRLRSLAAAAPLRSSYHTKSKSKFRRQNSQIEIIDLSRIQPIKLFTFPGEDGFSPSSTSEDGKASSEKTATKKPARRSSGLKYIPYDNSLVLSIYVSGDNVERAEEIFKEIQDSAYPVSSSDCKMMIRLYKKVDKEKIKSVLLFIEENDVEMTLEICTELLVNDHEWSWEDLVVKLDKFSESMESDGFVLIPNYVRAEIARLYISRKVPYYRESKAEEIMKQMEMKQGWEENRVACKLLLTLYADLSKADEVERIWKVCKSFCRVDDYSAAISAFCKVRRVKKAEDIFDKSIKSGMSISYKCYIDLMNVYLHRKLLAKAEDLVKRMASASRPIETDILHYFSFVRESCDSLVKLCVNAGEVEIADSVLLLQKELKQRGELTLQKQEEVHSHYLDMDDSSMVHRRLTKKELKQRRTTVW